MRVIVLAVILTGCGTVKQVNGVKYREPVTKQNVKTYTMVCVTVFGVLVWGMFNEKAIE